MRATYNRAGDFLGRVSYYAYKYAQCLASYQDLFLSMCGKEGGKEKTGKTLRRFASLLFSFPWSHALRHQSLAFRDYLTFV